MNRLPAIGLLIAGALLLVWGINASHSLGSNTAEVVTGAPSQKTIWLIVVGVIFLAGGLVGCFRDRKV